MRRVAPLVAVIAVLAACSGDGDGADGFPATEDGLRAAAAAQTQAFIDEPGTTYDFLSAECQASITRSDWAGQILLAAGLLEGFFDVKLSELTVGDVQVRNVTATSGEAAVELLTPDGESIDEGGASFSEFVYEDGTWKSTDCDEGLGEPVDDTAPTTTFDGELRPADEVTEEQTRAEAIAIELGQPFALGDVTVIVNSVEPGDEVDSFSGQPTVVVDLRVENRSAEEQSIPDVEIVCIDGTTGSWSGDSSFDLFGSLPTGSFEEGTLDLSPAEGCASPVLRVSSFFDEVAADYPLDELLADA